MQDNQRATRSWGCSRNLASASQVALIIYCIDRAHLSATLRGSNSSLEIAAASGALPVSAVAVHLID
jgi:uncharacterized membrane protein